MTLHSLFVIFMGALFLAVASSRAEDNPLMNSLMNEGVVVAKGAVVKLPAPTMEDGLSADEQKKSIASIPENRQTWDALSRRSNVAPFVLKISQSEGAEENVGRRVDLWFVAYGELEVLANEDYLRDQFQDASESSDADNKPKSQLLSDEALKKRNLTPPKRSNDPRYLSVEMTLLEKVRISGTTRSVRTKTSDSVTFASVLDEKFDDDPEFGNWWRPITRNDAGVRKVGAPQTYDHMGSYVKATRLVEPKGAIFIEYHVAFAEPKGWFNGANLLRSKLPIVAQDGVRRFRRNFEKQSKEAGSR